MMSEPDERLLGRFIAKGHNLHILKVSEGYRVDYWDIANVSGTLSQNAHTSLSAASVDFTSRVRELLSALE